jgi:hypothetical protein
MNEDKEIAPNIEDVTSLQEEHDAESRTEPSELLIDDSEETEPVATTPDPVINEVTDAIVRKKQNVIQEYDVNSDIKLTAGDQIIIPSNYDAETRDVLDKTPNINLLDNPESREWATTVAESLKLNTFNEAFVPTLEDPDAEFRHRVEHSASSLCGQSPKFKPSENQNLKGERATIRLISHLGLGTLFQVPLWHSGIWVTFKPPSDSEIIELNRILIADKISFGRHTYGLSFSNLTAYTIDRLIDFALAHIYDITAKSEAININDLKNFISCQDIPSFLWGFICTMYPRGFRYRRACTSDPEKCNYILDETLNVSKLQWTNVKALTDWQKTFMSGRQSKNKDLASITRYKEELSKIQKKKVIINEGNDSEITIIIKTPTLSEYIESGHRWIGDIVNTVDKALNSDSSISDKNKLIVNYGQASAMRQYAHWIDSIEYDTNVINDVETIEGILDVLSADDEIRTEFIKGVSDYINHSTVSVIGIPVYDCPNCSAVQENPIKLPDYKNIIPLDVVQLFFALLTQRLNRLIER